MRVDTSGRTTRLGGWLDAQRERYHQAPEHAGVLWHELLPTFLALPEFPPAEWPVVDFALLLCQLGYEHPPAAPA
ncbi:MAG: hypothetical protein U1E77_03330 [Inhella sp.]